MADDLDVDNLLEAPYKQENENGHSSGDRDRDRDRDRKKSSKDKRRSRSRDRDERRRGGDRDHKRRSRSRDRSRRSSDRGGGRDTGSRSSRGHRRSRSRERGSGRRGGGGGLGAGSAGGGGGGVVFEDRARSPPMPRENLTPEERDSRTVFCMQLAARLRPRDLEQFFSSVGKVRDVRIITDNKTRRSKGIAYIEFGDSDSVPLALGLNGQRLLGVPIIVQPSQAEKNRLASMANAMAPVTNKTGPMRLYVGSLHFNITEEMLRGIFEPFGKIDHINLVMDNETGRSKGFGFITFHNAEDAKKALDQLNGFELAGRPMKVGHVTERQGMEAAGIIAGNNSVFDTDEMDRQGIDLGATGRLQLMAKLAEGTGFQIPTAAANALSIQPGQGFGMPPQEAVAPPIATQCFMLSNMFEPQTETNPRWEVEIRDDVIEECNKHGGVLHIYVDKASPQGNVYVKCPTIAAAVASVNSLHGRFFAGRVITAAYVPVPNYHQLFPDAHRTTQLLVPSNKAMLAAGMPGMYV